MESNLEEPIKLKNNAERAKTAINVFYVFCGIALIALISQYFEIILLEKYINGQFLDYDEASSNDTRQLIIGILYLIAIIATIVVFLNWFRRAYGNLHRLNIPLEHSEKMAIWSFCIPFINLFRPRQIAEEILVETQIKIKEIVPEYTQKNKIFYINLWWGVYIISNIIAHIFLRMYIDAETVDELRDAGMADMVDYVLTIISALITIKMIKEISKEESMLFKAIELQSIQNQHITDENEENNYQ